MAYQTMRVSKPLHQYSSIPREMEENLEDKYESEKVKKLVQPQLSTWKTVLVSFGMVAAVALAWSMSTQFSRTTLNIDPSHFNAPYCMMWFNTNFMLLCYPAYIFYEMIRKSNVQQSHRNACKIFRKRGLHPISLLYFVVPFLVLWIAANYTYSRALTYIVASMATSITSCNAAIVYFLAIILLGDKFVPFKVVSVLFAAAGVVLISLDTITKKSQTKEWMGVVFALCSAFSSATYKVTFKRVFGTATLGQVSLFMTCLGVLNLLFNWIPPLILTQTKVELVDIGYVPWGPLCGAAALGLLFNFLVNFGIALLNPLVISVGMLLGMPVNAVIDIIFRGQHASGYFLGGTACVCISFLLIIFPYDLFCYKSKNVSEEEQSKL